LADLLVSDVLVGVLLVGVGTALSEQLLVVLGLEVFPAQWAIGSAHGGVSFDSGDCGEPVLTDAAMLASWRLRCNTNARELKTRWVQVVMKLISISGPIRPSPLLRAVSGPLRVRRCSWSVKSPRGEATL
jgi:hypothetical protein